MCICVRAPVSVCVCSRCSHTHTHTHGLRLFAAPDHLFDLEQFDIESQGSVRGNDTWMASAAVGVVR